MQSLTQQEIKMIEREANELYPMPDYKLKNLSVYRMAVREIKEQVSAYSIAATKYLTQLKSERERSEKLLEEFEYVKRKVSDSNLIIHMNQIITEYKNNKTDNNNETGPNNR